MATKKPTIAEIKRNTLAKSPYYFTRDSLKFFGQKMSDFKDYVGKNKKIYIYAKSYSRDYRTGKMVYMGYSIREYTNKGKISDLKLTNIKSLTELKSK